MDRIRPYQRDHFMIKYSNMYIETIIRVCRTNVNHQKSPTTSLASRTNSTRLSTYTAVTTSSSTHLVRLLSLSRAEAMTRLARLEYPKNENGRERGVKDCNCDSMGVNVYLMSSALRIPPYAGVIPISKRVISRPVAPR